MVTVPAPLRRRLLAFGLDYILIAAYLVVLVGAGVLLRAAAPDIAAALFGGPAVGELVGFLALTLPISLYFTLLEASPAGATWGKRRVGLRVVGPGDAPLSIGRSALRTALKFVPWELSHALIWRYAFAAGDPPLYLDLGLIVVWLLIGANVASAVLVRDHRSLYDLLSGTSVVTSATA
jgi:uncharacterized RDD family membrane protein YckC